MQIGEVVSRWAKDFSKPSQDFTMVQVTFISDVVVQSKLSDASPFEVVVVDGPRTGFDILRHF